MIERKIIGIGKGSLGIVLPRQLLNLMGIKEGDRVAIILTENTLKIVPLTSSEGREADAQASCSSPDCGGG